MYRRALTRKLAEIGREVSVRTVLVTTHLDLGLKEFVSERFSPDEIELRVCLVDDSGELKLVLLEDAGNKAWHQSDCGACSIETILRHL